MSYNLFDFSSADTSTVPLNVSLIPAGGRYYVINATNAPDPSFTYLGAVLNTDGTARFNNKTDAYAWLTGTNVTSMNTSWSDAGDSIGYGADESAIWRLTPTGELRAFWTNNGTGLEQDTVATQIIHQDTNSWLAITGRNATIFADAYAVDITVVNFWFEPSA